jgi:membrane fusion protein (multidrug efflux system)
VQLSLANKQIFDQLGTIETIEADFNNETGNIAFRATFLNPKGILRNGETGNILMPVQLKGALLIPQKATFETLDKKYVYIVDKEDVVNAQEIKVSQELPHLYVVSSGLSTEDKIVVEGLRKVKNKQKIQYDSIPMTSILGELHHLHAE